MGELAGAGEIAELGGAKGVGRCGGLWRVSCASWRGKARSGAIVLVSTFFWPRVLDHWRGVYGAREGKRVRA